VAANEAEAMLSSEEGHSKSIRVGNEYQYFPESFGIAVVENTPRYFSLRLRRPVRNIHFVFHISLKGAKIPAGEYQVRIEHLHHGNLRRSRFTIDAVWEGGSIKVITEEEQHDRLVKAEQVPASEAYNVAGLYPASGTAHLGHRNQNGASSGSSSPRVSTTFDVRDLPKAPIDKSPSGRHPSRPGSFTYAPVSPREADASTDVKPYPVPGDIYGAQQFGNNEIQAADPEEKSDVSQKEAVTSQTGAEGSDSDEDSDSDDNEAAIGKYYDSDEPTRQPNIVYRGVRGCVDRFGRFFGWRHPACAQASAQEQAGDASANEEDEEEAVAVGEEEEEEETAVGYGGFAARPVENQKPANGDAKGSFLHELTHVAESDASLPYSTAHYMSKKETDKYAEVLVGSGPYAAANAFSSRAPVTNEIEPVEDPVSGQRARTWVEYFRGVQKY
jgi:hypothetical protein